MKLKDLTQTIKPVHLIAVGLILVFNLVYFTPQLDGKIVKAHDAISSTA